MLQVFYRDDDRGPLTTLGLSSDLPDGVAEVHIVNEHYQHDCSSEFANVSNILNKKSGKLRKIQIEGIRHITPEFLAFFVLMSRKATEFSLHEILWDDGFCASIMGAIMHPDGPAAIEMQSTENDYTLSDHQIGLIFEAISSSSSLEHFSMIFPYSQDFSMESCRIVARALRRNRSLLSLELCVSRFPNSVFLQSIVSAACFGARLDTLKISDAFGGEHHLTLSTLVEGLCREGCQLKNVSLSFEIAVDVDLTDLAAVNSSLLDLHLRHANLTCAQFVDFASLFSSLQVLDIGQSPISDLRPLDALLLGEGSVLQRLDFSVDEQVGDDQWLTFFGKIPRMKSLKSLAIDHGIFGSFSEAQTRALLAALKRNNSLECCRVFNNLSLLTTRAQSEQDMGDIILDEADDVRTGAHWAKDDPENLLARISVPLSLNRAGRRALQNRPLDQPILKQELWPFVLERATELNYYSVEDNWKSPSLSSRRLDAVYWLLREIVFV